MLTLLLQTGLLVVAHGANPAWNAKVHETIAQVQWKEGPVATAFLMGSEMHDGGWNAGIAKLAGAGVKQIVVVPLMVSSAGGHYHQTRFYAGELPSLPKELAAHSHGEHTRSPVPIVVTAALDGAPELGAALVDLWETLPEPAQKRPFVLVGHGPTSDEEARTWVADLSKAASVVSEREGVPFKIGLLRDDAPAPIRAAAVNDIRKSIEEFAGPAGDSVTVLPILISSGSIGTVKIPRDLAGLPIRYQPAALAPSPHLARWIERVALARLESIR